MEFIRQAAGMIFVPRGETPAGYDFEVGDFTCDTTWRDLDLSAIIPVNTKLVYLTVRIRADLADKAFWLRQKGSPSTYLDIPMITMVANLTTLHLVLVVPDADGFLQYYGESATWAQIRMEILGWFV